MLSKNVDDIRNACIIPKKVPDIRVAEGMVYTPISDRCCDMDCGYIPEACLHSVSPSISPCCVMILFLARMN